MPTTDLFFSEYTEGSSNNKALEIYNGTGSAIDLSLEGYVVQMYFNGNTTPTTFNLAGVVESGDVFVFAQSLANETILAQADQTSGAGFFNGDDAIVLRKGGATGGIVDSIGQIGIDPGSEWGSGLTSTADNTLRRRTDIDSRDTNPLDTFDPSAQWDGFAQDTFDNLGQYEGAVGELTPGFVISESGDNTEVNEEGETTDTYAIALRTNPSSPVSIQIAADDQTEVSSDGVNFGSTATVNLSDTTPVTITVRALNDTTVEGPHSSSITHTIDTTDPDYSTLTLPDLEVDILDNDVSLSLTKVHEIQGTGTTSTLAGNTVTIEAVVVGDFQRVGSTFNLRGFYVQEEDADADSNPLTSEGLFIFDDAFGTDVALGDTVRITGTVGEFTSGSSSLTQLGNITNVTVVSANNALPTAKTLNFPVVSPADLEASEGMRVTIPTTLTVTEHFQLGRFGQVVLSSDGASNQAGTDGRLEQYTQFNSPSVEGYAAYLEDIAKRRIVLDDALAVQNPDPIIHGRGGQPLSASNTLRGGDTVSGLTGILDDRFGDAAIGNYRVQPTQAADFQPTNPRPVDAPEVGGSLKVASFNVLNFFNGDGAGGGFPTSRGADTAAEFERQRAKTISAILGLDADVVGLIEIENDGYGENSAIQDLVNGLNAIAGTGTYDFIDPGVDRLGSDEIAVGFIYKPGDVTAVGNAATVPDGFGQAAFDTDNRKPLAQTFQENASGEQFTAVINHFKSKGSSAGKPGDEDIGDGQGSSNGTRTRAAEDLVAWLATNPTGVTDPDYMVLGDINAYSKEDPIVALEDAGYTNLVSNTSYSYVFSGQWGSLDHALANGSLAGQVTGAAKWHINADEPLALDYNTNFKSVSQIDSLYSPSAFRSSDHDPVLVGLNLSSRRDPNRIDGTSRPDNLVGTDADDLITGFQGRDAIATGTGRDRVVYTRIADGGDTISDFAVGMDKIVVTQLLESVGYSGADPIAEGYLGFKAKCGDTQVLFNPGGAAQTAQGRSLVRLEGVSLAEVNTLDTFIL